MDTGSAWQIKFQIFGQAAVLLLCAGCVIVGDGVGNGTGEDIRVVLISKDERQKELVLRKGEVFGERRRSFRDEGFRYSVVRAYHMDGRIIGEVTIGNTKEWRKKYGKFVRIIVLKDKVHPMTNADFVSYFGKQHD